MRNIIYIFLILITFNKSFSQELLGQKNTIEITQKSFYDRSDFKEPERKETKIFDEKGRLIREIEFGFHHNTDLKLIGKIRSFEYQKNKLISEKSYSSETAFFNNRVQFYWNYIYDKSRLKKIQSNHSSYVYTYTTDNKLIEWTTTDEFGSRKFFVKYDDKKNVIERGEYGNWAKKYSRKNDTIKIIEYSGLSRKGDTTKTYISEVYSKDKITYRKKDGFGINTKKYIYFGNGDLKYVFTRVFDETEKDFKSELVYYPNGLIKQIRKYEFIENVWVLKQRIEFEINGRKSILNKKESENVNEILINGNKNWLQHW